MSAKFIFISLATTLSFCVGCHNTAVQPASPDYLTITLTWNKSYPVETRDSIELGLKWTFIYLGADLSKGEFAFATKWIDSTHVSIAFDKLGFNANAVGALTTISKTIQQSAEYSRNGSIDIGRFIMLTVGSSNHYYAITQANAQYADWRHAHIFDTKRVALLESNVSSGNRIIEMPDSTSTSTSTSLMGFVSHEGTGSVAAGTFAEHEFEITQLMSNGQFRFAVYDTLGRLLPCADTLLSAAAKPAKCLWCHEENIQPTFAAVTQAPPQYYSFDEFDRMVMQRKSEVDAYRASLTQDIDYKRRADHRSVAMLYITFMEPSAQHLANEWNISEDSVKKKLAGFPMHRNPEYDWLGDLYDRNDVDGLGPFATIHVPQSARAPSAYEPDFFR